MEQLGNERKSQGAGSFWSVVSSPGFTFAVFLGWILWLSLSAQIPAGLLEPEVKDTFRFGVAKAIQQAGLHDALASWVAGLLLLLTLLSFFTRMLRASSVQKSTARGVQFPMAARTPGEMDTWFSEKVGIRNWGEDRGTLRGERGRFLEGGILVLLAFAMLVVGYGLGWSKVAGIAELQRGPEGVWTPNVQQIRGTHQWREGELPFSLQCRESRSSSGHFTFSCIVGDGASEMTGTLEMSNPLRTPRGTVRLKGARRVQAGIGQFSIAARGREQVARQHAIPGEAYQVRIEGEENRTLRLRFFESTGGGFGTVEDGQTTLGILSPFVGTTDSESYTSRLSAPMVLQVEWVKNRLVAWFVVAALLALLGALMMVVLPQVSVKAQLKEDGGYLVQVTSLNRPTLPFAILRESQPSKEDHVSG